MAAGIYAGFVIGTSFLILRNNKRASNSHRDVDDTHSSELAGIVGQNESKFGGGGGGGGGYGRCVYVPSESQSIYPYASLFEYTIYAYIVLCLLEEPRCVDIQQ